MNNPISNNNDDDIFDNNVTLSDTDNPNVDISRNNKSATSESYDSLNGIINSFFSTDDHTPGKIQSLIDHIRSKHNIDISKIISNLRYDITSTLYNSMHNWSFNNNVDRTSVSVYRTLNDLTNGRHSLYHKFYELELDIIKAIVLNKFISSVFFTSSDKGKLEELNNALGINFDSRYIKTYFKSFVDINSFTISQNIAVYKVLGEELGIAIDPNVLAGKKPLADLSLESQKDRFFNDSLSVDLKEKLSQSLSNELSIYEANSQETK